MKLSLERNSKIRAKKQILREKTGFERAKTAVLGSGSVWFDTLLVGVSTAKCS